MLLLVMDAEVLNQFLLVTGLDEKEIVETLEYLPLSTQEALWFFLYYNRWPSDNEATFMQFVGWEVWELMMSKGIVLQD